MCNVILYCSYSGGFAPGLSTVQNIQAHSEFLTTSIPKQNPQLLSIFANIKSAKLKVSRFLPKVLAEIQTPSEPESAVTSLKNNLDSLTRNVVKAANSVPGVKAAAFGELKVTPEERVSEAPDEAQDSSIGSPQPGTEAQAPGAPDEAQDERADKDDQLWQQNWFIIALAVCIPLSLVFLYILYSVSQKILVTEDPFGIRSGSVWASFGVRSGSVRADFGPKSPEPKV